ncbi:MAG TPA: methyltransferase [Azonexus sp.]|nr:methyltransferase [Azonexus sp.]
MNLAARQRQLDALLLAFRPLWHPQPFREIRPDWCTRWPALADELLVLPDDEVVRLNDDGAAALARLARYWPEVEVIAPLSALPELPQVGLAARGDRWAWEIPGRKREQIEAFAAAARCSGQPVIDWCGGKGHLGRLLASEWQSAVHTLEIDPALCVAGEVLAQRASARQQFVQADALSTADWPSAGQHAVALHACGELHRRLIRHGAEQGVGRFDIAPCCYYRGVEHHYQPLSATPQLRLTRDDTRLAVTETVTAAPRETRQRDRAIAWKLGFDAYRRTVSGEGYRNFKPVADAWLRDGFADFLGHMNRREGLPEIGKASADEFERLGWQRLRDLMRLSIVRHAFRRPLEVWLALDLAVALEQRGYSVTLGSFCERRLTPRNLLISAQLG